MSWALGEELLSPRVSNKRVHGTEMSSHFSPTDSSLRLPWEMQ